MSFEHPIPIIDLGPLRSRGGDAAAVASAISQVCREHGFFYIVDHGVADDLQARLEDLSGAFFAQDLDTKMRIRMERAGRAWRGYFPVGDELTLGKPDQKEGLYFGAEQWRPVCRCMDGTCFPMFPAFGKQCWNTWTR